MTQLRLTTPVKRLFKLVADLPPDLRALCEYVVLNHKFQTWPGSTKWHHTYNQGLIQHTGEVCDLALTMGQGLETVNRNRLLVAGVWHDFMKIRDYEFHIEPLHQVITAEGPKTQGGIAWEKTPYAKQIHHVAGSYATFVQVATEEDLPSEFIDDVGHIILAHHGRPEWGSAISPRTIEAHLLHTADMISAGGLHQPYLDEMKTYSL